MSTPDRNIQLSRFCIYGWTLYAALHLIAMLPPDSSRLLHLNIAMLCLLPGRLRHDGQSGKMTA